IANLKTRSASGAMVPIGSVATFDSKTGPYRVVRYNLHPAVEVDGDTAPGFSSGRSLVTRRETRRGVAVDLDRGVEVVTHHPVGPGLAVERGDRSDRHHRARGRAGLEVGD